MKINNNLLLKIKYIHHLEYLINKYEIDLHFNIFKYSKQYKNTFINDINNLIDQTNIHQSWFEYRNYINDFYNKYIYLNIFNNNAFENLIIEFANIYNKYTNYKWSYVQTISNDNTGKKLIKTLDFDLHSKKLDLIIRIKNLYFLNIGFSKVYNGYFVIPFNISDYAVNNGYFIYSPIIVKNTNKNFFKFYNFTNKKINLVINKLIESIYDIGHESPIFELTLDVFKDVKGVIM